MTSDPNKKMRLYWNDCGRGVESSDPKPATMEEVNFTWSDEVRGVEGNFLGLVDDQDRAIQFLFVSGIPDHIGDAGHLQIVRMDFPVPAEGGSYFSIVKIDDIYELIARAFEVGAMHEQFEVEFEAW